MTDAEILLRIIQSVPSPKAEPIKQWLAREGARRLDAVTRPIDATQARVRPGSTTPNTSVVAVGRSLWTRRPHRFWNARLVLLWRQVFSDSAHGQPSSRSI